MTISCDELHANYPLTQNGAKCSGYDYCSNNYREDENGNACSEFDNCIDLGDGDGVLDNNGDSCSNFEYAKLLFDIQYPLIHLAEIGENTKIHIELIELDEFKDSIQF